MVVHGAACGSGWLEEETAHVELAAREQQAARLGSVGRETRSSGRQLGVDDFLAGKRGYPRALGGWKVTQPATVGWRSREKQLAGRQQQSRFSSPALVGECGWQEDDRHRSGKP